ncbi:hypothetical protein [Phenylobacterium aquaticum]|uniref:hypothetical protein n=1 Tax=Phenylobacterium aquaticum TaxID=1763816 RepID=UPI0026EC71AD|nr:hypothetical protein [Phenylobacterium aquaticum]
MTSPPLRLSPLAHTWMIDLDGVVFPHNGHLRGDHSLLPGVRELWAAIPADDRIILMSARGLEHQATTLAVMAAEGLRVDHALFGLPAGERILINDAKPSGLITAHAINLARDAGPGEVVVEVSPDL